MLGCFLFRLPPCDGALSQARASLNAERAAAFLFAFRKAGTALHALQSAFEWAFSVLCMT